MRISNSFDEVTYNENTVLTVGTFDGVHQGHKQIIDKLISVGRENNYRHLLVTFDPHPQIVLQKKFGKEPIKLLSTIFERVWLLERAGIENTFIIPFSFEFSQTSPINFVKDYLVHKIGLKKILIGYDHLFGKNREGDRGLLMNLGRELGFEVEKVNQFTEDKTPISSTKIREALKKGELDYANKMLGYDYFADGYVTKGLGRGTKLGYPTANVAIPDKNKQLPASGVNLISGKIGFNTWFGMANIGTRPTFSNDNDSILEVNFFDFNQNIYMAELRITFHRFIRNEIKFNSVEELKERIAKDKVICEELINKFYN
jgi:riboflavin kinase/FMN adenylyltransferase